MARKFFKILKRLVQIFQVEDEKRLSAVTTDNGDWVEIQSLVYVCVLKLNLIWESLGNFCIPFEKIKIDFFCFKN